MERLGNYEIIEKIGAGGMGEVYRARDTRLGREVALKMLPPAFAADPDRLSRFEREARVLAALNYPGIAAIYGLEKTDGKPFLVLELVPGEDLSARIAQGALPLDEALPIAQAIAEALEYAHEQGIVHRDLKPANVKLTPDGRVKVLDFGLAKAFESEDGGDPRLSQSPTVLASSPTVAGVILGTAAYMSPEQARGKSVDKRSDVFAFGSVLYEMLTGKQAFAGETVSDTLASVLKTQPEVTVLPESTPRAIRDLLRRCLEKDARLRLRDIGEARITIERARHAGPDGDAVVAPAPPVDGAARFRANLVWGVATLVIAAGAFFASRLVTPVRHDAPLRKFSIELAEDGQSTDLMRIALSPDGGKIAYVHDNALWVRDLSRLDALEIPATKGVEIPFWSPDSRQVGYRVGNTFYRVNATGGASTVISTTAFSFISGSGAVWTDDDRILFTIGSRGIFEVSALGGDPVEVVPRDEKEVDLHEPGLLPGGRGYLFVEHRQDAGPSYLAVYTDGKRKTLLSLEGQRIWTPRYSDTGHILFRRTPVNEGLWALPFSLSELEVTGEPFLVALDGSEPCPGPNGSLIYRLGSEVAQSQLAWINPDGTFDAAISDVFSGAGTPAISPDGGRVAGVVSEGGAAGDLWVFDLERGTRQRMTFEPAWEILPCWSPDGKTIYYTSTSDRSIRARKADGTGAEVLVTYGYRPTLSPDGKWLAFDDDSDICMVAMPADTTSEVKRVVATRATETDPVIAPSGNLVAYASDESGREEIYLTHFPSGEGKWQVSVDGGNDPTWDPAGGVLYFLSETKMMRVDVTEKPDLRLGNPRALFSLDEANVTSGRLGFFAVDRGGKRMVVGYHPSAGDHKPTLSIAIVENWLSEFAKKN